MTTQTTGRADTSEDDDTTTATPEGGRPTRTRAPTGTGTPTRTGTGTPTRTRTPTRGRRAGGAADVAGSGDGTRRGTASGRRPRSAAAGTTTGGTTGSLPTRRTARTATGRRGSAGTSGPAADETVRGPNSTLRSNSRSNGSPRSTGERVRPGGTAGHPSAAAVRADRHNAVHVTLPVLGTVRLPAADELAFLGGVGALAVVGVIEWPVAVALGAGHALAAMHRGRVLREFGEALEEA